ncbi:MAG: LuxR C-terminal-related transcriptional regulator [Actinomycetota bacterium]
MRLPEQVSSGFDALATGDWVSAKRTFEDALVGNEGPEVLDGLGRSLWWLKDVRGAIELRTRAYNAYKKAGKIPEAVSLAVWLSRELRTLFRNDAGAEGWLARAETLADDTSESSVLGWILLARAEASDKAIVAIADCVSALEIARRHDDSDLEVVTLARLGLLEVAIGKVDDGIRHLDEAMAAAGAGEADDLQTIAETYCALMEAAEMLGDSARFAQWTSVIADLKSEHGFGPLGDLASSVAYGNLSAFCGACCGGMYLVTGHFDEAEAELLRAISDLEAGGMESRCVHPVTQLAELRVLQGRFEEAQTLLEHYEDLPESVRPLAVLDLARHSPDTAAARIRARLDELDDLTVATLPLQTVLLDAYLEGGDLDASADVARRVEEIAGLTKSKRHLGEALFAKGKLMAARSDDGAPEVLRDASRTFSEASMALPACRARMGLARTLVESDRGVAISEARAALAAFERLGAVPDADAASAFLRDLGVKGRTGPKNLELLSKRELEVLRLVAQGLSNPEIAERLFISTKTAGHHVSNILSKLGLRSRTEAAAYAAINLEREQARK